MTVRRHLAQLGGTTTTGDAALAAAHAVRRSPRASGPQIRCYEQGLARVAGVEHAVVFGSGRVALFAILEALGAGGGTEVIVPLPTHVVVPNAVRYLGATPVYADCRLSDYNVDPDAVEAAISPRTRAVLVQHTFGNPADLERLLDIAQRRDVPLVEDCVHALGASWRGRPVGSVGVAGFFSTEETKIVSTTMGGAAVTSDLVLEQRLREFQAACPAPDPALVRGRLAKLAIYHVLMHPRAHRLVRPLYELGGGRNPLPQPTTAEELAGKRPERYEERLAAGQAELGSRQLARLDANLVQRERVADRYAAGLAPLGFAPPAVAPESRPAWVRYPVRVADRPAAERVLRKWIVPGTWFTSVQEEAVDPAINGYRPGSCPRAELAARQLVNLPTHPRVTAADADCIIEAMAAVEPAAGQDEL